MRDVAVFIGETLFGIRVGPVSVVVLLLHDELQFLAAEHPLGSAEIQVLRGALDSYLELVECPPHQPAITEVLEVQHQRLIVIMPGLWPNLLRFEGVQQPLDLFLILEAFDGELVVAELLAGHEVDIRELHIAEVVSSCPSSTLIAAL